MTTAQFIASYTASCEQRIREIAAMDAKTLQRKAPHIKGGRKARIAYLQDSIRAELKNQIAKAKALDAIGV